MLVISSCIALCQCGSIWLPRRWDFDSDYLFGLVHVELRRDPRLEHNRGSFLSCRQNSLLILYLEAHKQLLHRGRDMLGSNNGCVDCAGEMEGDLGDDGGE